MRSNVRLFRAIIENIPIRYFMAIVFIIAALFIFLIDYFVVQPFSQDRAFTIVEQDFSRQVQELQNSYNVLLSRETDATIEKELSYVIERPELVAITISSPDAEPLFSVNAADKHKDITNQTYPFVTSIYEQALTEGKVLVSRDDAANLIQGYAGLNYTSEGDEKQAVLILTRSTKLISAELQSISDFYIATIAASLIGLAMFTVLVLSAKIHDRVSEILAVSKALAAQKENIEVKVRGHDELGQIAESLRETSAILKVKRQRLNEAIQKAETANTTKSEFLSNMSHEIRTPMNGVISGLNLLQSSSSEEERNELLAASLSSAQALMEIINDILDFSKLEAGKLIIAPAPFLLARMLKDIKLLMGPIAAEKATRITLEMNKECDSWIMADEVRLRQIMNNLVSNAVKFTDDGDITITAHLSGEKSAELEVRVQDTGIGIPAKDLDTLFDRFTQVKNAETQKSGGTGLGLAICSQLVDLMDGKIHVESEPGAGSCFWFKVPVSIEHNHEATKSEVSKDMAISANILLAEDIPVNQMLITKMLKQLGHEVTVAVDGAKAISALEKSSYDLVLMDNQMPNMSGMEATSAIRAREDDLAKTPIIALTADAMIEQREAFFEAGVNGFVSKPIAIDKLRFEITKVLQA